MAQASKNGTKITINKEETEDSLEVFLSTESEDEDGKDKGKRSVFKKVKVIVLVAIWLVCSTSLLTNNVKVEQMHQLSVPRGRSKSYLIFEEPIANNLRLTLEGAFLPPYYRNLSINWMSVWIQLKVLRKSPRDPTKKIKNSNIILTQNISEVWELPLVSEKLIDIVPGVTYRKTFHLHSIKVDNDSHGLLEIKFSTNMQTNFPLSVGYNLQPINLHDGVIYAAFILVALYILIIFELVHRTLAAMLATTMSVAILAVLNARPTMSEIISWIDVETLVLLFSMMMLVTILSETGIFDYASVFAYKITGGRSWPLINTLCVLAAISSCFLDNVTTSLLFTPVTIRLCEMVNLNPVKVLIYMLIFTNVGGAITPIGDPPNVIIASNSDVLKAGINFGTFTLHMGVGTLLSFFVVYAYMRLMHPDENYFKYSEPTRVEELKREIAVWKRAAASLSSYSKDEDVVKESLLKKSFSLLGKLKDADGNGVPSNDGTTGSNNKNSDGEDFRSTLKDLENKYPIKNKVLLIKSGVTLLLVMALFFLHSIPAVSILGLGWTALLGALLLLLLYGDDDIEAIFTRIEWSTLLFFASLFILMEALAKLGLIEWVGQQTRAIIMSVDQENRLTAAIVLILWISGFASAFVDNLPLTTMMVRIATNLADNAELDLPLQPLIWALSFGACFGGNGTLFGSSSNIVCAGVAEQHGHRFSFLQFTKVGLPIMILTMLSTTIYLIICHVIFCWH